MYKHVEFWKFHPDWRTGRMCSRGEPKLAFLDTKDRFLESAKGHRQVEQGQRSSRLIPHSRIYCLTLVRWSLSVQLWVFLEARRGMEWQIWQFPSNSKIRAKLGERGCLEEYMLSVYWDSGPVWNNTCYACTGHLGTSNLIHAMCVLGEWGRHQG